MPNSNVELGFLFYTSRVQGHVIYLTSFNFCFAKNHSSNEQSAHCFVVVLPDLSLRCNGWSIGYGCWSVCQLQWIIWIEYSNSIGIETTDVKLGFLCVPLTFSQETSFMLWKQVPAKKQQIIVCWGKVF